MSFQRAAALSLLVSVAALSPASAQTSTTTVVTTYMTAFPWRQDVYVIAPPVMSPILVQHVSYPALAPVRHPERARVLRRHRGWDY